MVEIRKGFNSHYARRVWRLSVSKDTIFGALDAASALAMAGLCHA